MVKKNNENDAKKLKNKKQTAIICGAVAVIILLAAVIIYLLTRNPANLFEYEDNVTIGEMPGVDHDAMRQMLQEMTDKSAIAYSINSRPTVVGTMVNLMFENPEGNEKDVIINLRDDNTGEIIYQSRAIREGTFLDVVTLNKEYPPGQYGVTAVISGYDKETHQIIGETAAGLVLNVPEP